VVWTVGGDRDADIAALNAGADDYLVKSQIEADSLEHALRYAVSRRRRKEALRQSEERFRLAARAAGEIVWEWNAVNHSLWLDDEFETVFGALQNRDAPLDEIWNTRIHSGDRRNVALRLRAALQSDAASWSGEFRFCRNDESCAVVLVRGSIVRDKNGAALRIVGTLADVSERRAWEEQLVHRAFHDTLTQLPNRALFMDRLERALARTRRNADCRFAVIFLDLDGFKEINDSRGHLAGDALLRDVAARLQSAVRPGDTVARLGGDEFTALLEDIADEAEARHVAGRIHDALSLPLQVTAQGNRSQQIQIGASIGITLGLPHYARPDDILRDADIAMYRAKAAMREDGARHIIFYSEQPVAV